MRVKVKFVYFGTFSSKKFNSYLYDNLHERSRSFPPNFVGPWQLVPQHFKEASESISVSGATEVKEFLPVKCRFNSILP